MRSVFAMHFEYVLYMRIYFASLCTYGTYFFLLWRTRNTHTHNCCGETKKSIFFFFGLISAGAVEDVLIKWNLHMRERWKNEGNKSFHIWRGNCAIWSAHIRKHTQTHSDGSTSSSVDLCVHEFRILSLVWYKTTQPYSVHVAYATHRNRSQWNWCSLIIAAATCWLFSLQFYRADRRICSYGL